MTSNTRAKNLSWPTVLVVALSWPGFSSGHSAGGCETYPWNLSREFSALDKPATLVAASADRKVNPVRLVEGRRFAATLLPQGSVGFVVPPARAHERENATAGLLFFRSGAAGRYRISLSSHHWIDVLDAGKPIDSRAHEGRDGCVRLRKTVEFDLPANRDLVLQLSGDSAVTVDVVIAAISKP